MSRTPQQASGSRAYREAWRAVNLLIRSGGSWSGRERDVCYRNLGNGKFEDQSFLSGLDSSGDGRAFATLDLDFGNAAMHYCFFLAVTILLRFAIGLPPLWQVAGGGEVVPF